MAYIGNPPIDARSFGSTKFEFTASAGQTAFTGADDNNKTLSFTENHIEVYVNGVLMDNSDFSTSGGNTVTLAAAAAVNDIISVIAIKVNVPRTDYVPKTGGTFTGAVTVEGNLNVEGTTTTIDSANAQTVDLGDNDKIQLGDGNDLQLYHDGSNSYIRDTGTGNLNISGDEVRILNAANNEIKSLFTTDGAVEFYHDNDKKFETTSTGVSVSGNIANASGDLTLDVAGKILLSADDAGTIQLLDGPLHYGSISEDNSNLIIQSIIENEDILFKGNDGGSTITALTLDMSDAGTATFNHDINAGGNLVAKGYLASEATNSTNKWLAYTYTDNTFRINYNGAGADELTIDSSGNVGINTAAPAEKVHIEGGSLLIDAFNAGNETGIFFREGFTSSNKYNVSILAYDHASSATSPDGISINGYDGVSICTGSNSRNERLRVNVDGEVSINKQDAQGSKLTLEGSINTRNGRIDLASNTLATGSQVNAGCISFQQGFAGTYYSGHTFKYTYAATSWKSFYICIKFSSTTGGGEFIASGYNNNGGNVSIYETDPSNTGTLTHSRNGQQNIFTLTLNNTCIHPLIQVKYCQSGGDGNPTMNRMNFAQAN